MALSIVADPGTRGYCLTILPERPSATATSVTMAVRMSVRKKDWVFCEKLDQQVAPWPVMGNTWLFAVPAPPAPSVLRSNVEKPMPASVARTAFLPGMRDIEKGRRPPCAGGLAVNRERAVVRDVPRTRVGGTPLTETSSLFESSLKKMSDTDSGGPVGGVVCGRLIERAVGSATPRREEGERLS